MKTQFEIETMELNKQSLMEVVRELKELNKHLYFNNLIQLYEQNIIFEIGLRDAYNEYLEEVCRK